MQKSPIAPGTFTRMKHVAARANAITQHSYLSLIDGLRDLSQMRDLSLQALDHWTPDRLPVASCTAFAEASAEVASLTVELSQEMIFLSRLTLTDTTLTPAVRQVLTHFVGPAGEDFPAAIDFRQQRIRRMPLDDALNLVMSNIENMCERIGGLVRNLVIGETADALTAAARSSQLH
jgi:hypothetical protein